MITITQRPPVRWIDSDPASLAWDRVSDRLSQDGYCVIAAEGNAIDDIFNLTRACGQIQNHELADASGITEIHHQTGSENAGFYRAIDATPLRPHTDGTHLDTVFVGETESYLVGPPKIVILQTVRKADQGGDTTLIDVQRIARDIVRFQPHCLEELTQSVCSYFRKNNKALHVPLLYRANSNWYWLRLHTGSIQLSASGSSAVQSFIEWLKHEHYSVQFKLQDNEILLIDNLRMLHARSGFMPTNEDGSYRHLRRTWVYNNLCLDGGNLTFDARTAAGCFHDARPFFRHPQSGPVLLNAELGIRFLT